MARGIANFVSILLIGASTITAEYTQFYWPNATSQLCPNMKYSCKPPSICARSDPQKIWYCCVPGDKDQVCHTSAAGCDGGSGKPSGAQQSCSSGVNAFCCLDQSQRCTQQYGQINICWATAPNPVAMLNATQMNQTYSSLFAARPSAASYTIELAALQTMTSTTAGASSSPSAGPTSASSSAESQSPTSSPPPANNSDSGLSGGAIGGIVGGVVGGIALIGAIGFLLWRRKKYSTIAQADPSSPPNGHQPYAGYQANTAYPASPGYQQDPAEMHNMSAAPTEKYARMAYPSEMPAQQQQPVEMSADPYRAQH